MASASWSDGYVADIDYTHGYYSELSPHTLTLALQLNSVRADLTDLRQPLRYLELGFGQGLSLNIHAAATGGEYWGNDFNPAHAANARELARASGANVHVLDDSFAQLAAREDLPEFDVIALHGIWSWISDENRRIIVDIAKRKLAVGGIFYISYNCTPGWSAAMPLRHLMALHSELAGSDNQTMAERVEAALSFTRSVADSGARYFADNPAVAERLTKMSDMGRNYLAHEYFNLDWHPMPFSSVAGMLDEAKLGFAASANFYDHIDYISLTAESRKLLAGISNPTLKQSVRDYCSNVQFRKDIWVKGARQMPASELGQVLGRRAFALLNLPAQVPTKVTSVLGEVSLNQDLYGPLIAALAANDFAPKTLQVLHQSEGLKTAPAAQLMQGITMLYGMGQLAVVQEPAAIKAARPRCEALNTHITNRSLTSSHIAYLASPVTGGGVVVPRFHQLFLRSWKAGRRSVTDISSDTWNILLANGERMVKDGKTLEAEADNLADIAVQVEDFLRQRLPILKALGLG